MTVLSRRALLAASAAAVPAAPVRLQRKVKVALWGLQGHPDEILRPLPELPDVQLTGVYDADRAAAEKTLKRPGAQAAKVYTDPVQMLDRERPDVVAVCNNNGERAEAILKCCERKLNVIAEKPLAIRRADYRKVQQAVRSSGIRIGMLLPMRFEPHYFAMHDLVKRGAIGEVAQISSQKSYKAGSRAEWFKHRETYGSTILWIGIHMFDLMRWIGGREFKQAAGFRGHVQFPDLGEMENVTASVFQLDNHGTAELHMDYLRAETAATHGDDRLRLAGTEGVIEYQAATGLTLMTRSEKPRAITDLPREGSVFVDYLLSIYGNRPAVVTPEDIFRVSEITLAAHEAAESGRTIAV